MQTILYSFTTVSPIFIIIGIGVLLRRIKLIDTDICGHITKLVYYVFLPALLLHSFVGNNHSSALNSSILLVILLTLFIQFVVSWLIAVLSGKRGIGRGMFASGCCWGNVAIIGFGLAQALYGEVGLQRAVIFSGITLPLHLITGYIAMGRSFSVLLRRIVINPVIMSFALGQVLNLLSFQMPQMASEILGILGRASLPLALVAIGGSLEFNRKQWHLNESLIMSAMKLLFMPLLAFLLARFFGLEDAWIGTIVVGFSCPIAVSFFVISRSMGIEASRGAAIITTSTVAASITTGLIAALLQ